MKKRGLVLIMSLCLFMSVSSMSIRAATSNILQPVQYDVINTGVQKASPIIHNTNAYSFAEPNKLINTYAVLQTVDNGSLSISVTLQSKNSSGTWVYVTSWTNSVINKKTITVETSYTGQKGVEYRAVVSFSATVNGTTDTRSLITNTATAF